MDSGKKDERCRVRMVMLMSGTLEGFWRSRQRQFKTPKSYQKLGSVG